ncbi:MAG: DUF4097 domain-containing protein [Lachnospiraceae bacterium]|nr:DUF4097 domain-containing protein [Lachnospiraceae bacterium]
MKKKSAFFAILGTLLGIGIVLTIVGVSLGGRLQSMSIRLGKNNKSSVSNQIQNISLPEKDIKKLDFDLAASSIKIRRGETFGIQGSLLSVNKAQNGVWTVESRLSDHFDTVNIFGIVNLPIPFREDRQDKADKIVITIPENAELEEIDMELKASTVNIENLNSKNIDLELSAGDLTIDSITAAKADLSVSAGDITIKQYNISEDISLDCSVGKISFGSRQYAESNVCSNLEADCSMGDIDVYGKLTGDNYLDCSMGSISVNLVGSNANYQIKNSDSTFGSINYSTKQFTKKSNSYGDISVNPDTNIYGTLGFDCSMGSIDICYLYASPAGD